MTAGAVTGGAVKGSTATRLRRLRWWLTALLTVLNAAGVIVLAGLLVSQDSSRADERLDAGLRTVTEVVVRLIQYDGALLTADLASDEISGRCPQFAILPGGTDKFATYRSDARCAPLDEAVLEPLAVQSVRTGRELRAGVRGTGGEPIRIWVKPFQSRDGKYIGAVAAAVDAEDEHARHQQLFRRLIGGCLLQMAAVGVAGHLLSGRIIRPALAALEQQETLLADTAHDLRGPVTALRALAETALDDSAQRAELLSRTVNLAGRMGGVIDALLMRARLAAGVQQLDIQPVWLDQLVTAVVDQTRTDGARITLTAAPTRVDVDPGLVQRAIGNLLDNALRHGRLPDAPAVVHITVAGGRIVVADHGPGIDASVAPETFDRFSSGGGSTGLGLPIVRWVAQAHGGTLRVYNAEEGGAIFELILPTSDA